MPGSNLDEEYILVQLKRRNKKVFELIFNKYYKSLLRFAEHHVFSQDTANDIVQETFLRLWEKAPRLHINTSLKAYLFRSVRNRCLDYLRHIQVQDKYKQQLIEAQIYSRATEVDIDRETDRKINEAIQSLPDQCKKILQLSFFEGKKYDEIARQLDISINTVKTQVSRAYKHLRKTLVYLHTRLLVFF